MTDQSGVSIDITGTTGLGCSSCMFFFRGNFSDLSDVGRESSEKLLSL